MKGAIVRALIQRVSHARVDILDDTPAGDELPVRSIERGYVVLLGVGAQDTQAEADKLWSKILKLRIFDDAGGRTNLALSDIEGQVMVVSQFTLYADCRRGNRPGFSQAGSPVAANELYRYFVSLVRRDLGRVATGEFGAHMEITLSNDGPFTIWLDTDEFSRNRK